jgi:methylglutaconyl-CoA hydratase
MKPFETIAVETKGSVARVDLNRPKIHNAFNEVMLAELVEAFKEIAGREEIRAVVLTGRGKSFCAGADLRWMGKMVDYSFEENLADSNVLADCMHRLYTLPQPTICRVNGAAIGGGMGLVAACDIVIAADHARFSLSEVKIGLVPACISPFVLKRAGEATCRELFLTGERISAERALAVRLVNQVVPADRLDEAVEARIGQLLSSGPKAIATCKELIRKVPGMSLEDAGPYTAEVIARLRISDEGQEGIQAFLEKRKPAWNKDAPDS